MAYVYLLDLYKYIEERLGHATDELNHADGDAATAKFEQGRIDALTEFQDFLTENFNPKLPRRIRETYFGKMNKAGSD
ncbi:hypothetical protein D1BOALGB6SA_3300 [Olavius sp. associated proteobacterium Delta 1]|nr:hypothetical protein D1BOALGB6SA_3300 [Olavius sp. associated proteobacterium Delta 1]